ncbi:MAG TPA: ParB/RepB/Spo0J family partition protein [Chthoniobacteraceae bacterium]|nr:ParB/RepB/Spo0J family partition protein [Chthoniobacteraceae bacterium]
MSKVALGKGLGALIAPRIAAPQPVLEAGEKVRQVPIDSVVASPLQPRSDFRGERLEELMESIREHGIIQPLIVRQRGGRLELIAGERRWRAARRVGLTEVPVITREAGDQEVLELALIENIQREDLNPIEEALAYQRLTREFSLRQEDIAQKVGKSRASIANCIRLLELAPEVREWLAQGRLTVGHAKVLLGARNPADQKLLAEAILREGLTVRATERLLASHLERLREPAVSANPGDETGRGQLLLSPALVTLQKRLAHHFNTPVTLRHGEKKGKIEVEYRGDAELKRLIALLGLQDE